jgi:pyruvate,water dikinase
MTTRSKKNILWFEEISIKDIPLVGGKNASLGEMFSNLTEKGVSIPNGFATTSHFYRYFLEANDLLPKLKEAFKGLDSKNIRSLQRAGKKARGLIMDADFPEDLKEEIIFSYRKLSEKYKTKNVDVAVRSSATAEDLPDASFAGQHESYLNVEGEKELLEAVKKCIVSLFNDRAISYREERGFDHFKVALSVGIQKMIRSDLASAGVMFTIDTESGFKDVVLINGSWGLGEMVVKGRVITDEFLVFKPTLEKGFEPIISKKLGTKRRKLIYETKKKTAVQTIEIPVPEKDRRSLL